MSIPSMIQRMTKSVGWFGVVFLGLLVGVLLFSGWRGTVTFWEFCFGWLVMFGLGGLATVFALLTAPFVAAFAVMLAKPHVKWGLKQLFIFLDLVPTVVLGYIGIVYVLPMSEAVWGKGTALTFVTLAVILGFSIMPSLINGGIDAFETVSAKQQNACIALGATRWQLLWYVLLPATRHFFWGTGVQSIARAGVDIMALVLFESTFAPQSSILSNTLQYVGYHYAQGPETGLFLAILGVLVFSITFIILGEYIKTRGTPKVPLQG